MNTREFTKELAKRRGLSEPAAYFCINTVMDTIRQMLSEGDEVQIGSFGKFTIITDISGNRIPTFVCGKAFRQAVTAGEGIV